MSLFSFSDYPKAEAEYSVAIVAAEFNEEITAPMVDLTFKTLKKCGISGENIKVINVPGCFEIPYIAKRIIKGGEFDGVIAIGAVIRGETPHFDYVAGECARGIMDCNLEGEIPVAFGILTCDTVEQAEARVERASDFAKTVVEQMNNI